MSLNQEKDLPDMAIRAQLWAREETALSEVQTRWGRLLYGLAYRITGSPEDAEECVNDAILDLWQTPPADPDMPILAYISTLVRRRAVDRIRFNRAACRGGGQPTCALDELDECLASPASESDVDASAIRDALQAFLDGLDGCNRKIFLLRYYSAFSNADIAFRCGLGERAVEMRLCRMRKRLRRVLNEYGIYI
ncbi:MAG: sigma-70 family RNA polymerase sigma factor [Ruminococcaceae bacterium]|nr:sigma-70 family RNA polymerase sigma factor [Oscillospiraceae bacterium]